MYGRLPQVMAQFVLKIERFLHIIGTAPILQIAQAYDLRPRLWPPILRNRLLFLTNSLEIHWNQPSGKNGKTLSAKWKKVCELYNLLVLSSTCQSRETKQGKERPDPFTRVKHDMIQVKRRNNSKVHTFVSPSYIVWGVCYRCIYLLSARSRIFHLE